MLRHAQGQRAKLDFDAGRGRLHGGLTEVNQIRKCMTCLFFVIAALSVSCSEGDSSKSTTASSSRAGDPDSTATESSGSASSSSRDESPPRVATVPEPEPLEDPEALAKRGNLVYMSNCQVCHNPDPSLDGSIGPAISGASQELLEARILRAEYPEGYQPKRDTRLMIALPHLAPDLEALLAFLSRP